MVADNDMYIIVQYRININQKHFYLLCPLKAEDNKHYSTWHTAGKDCNLVDSGKQPKAIKSQDFNPTMIFCLKHSARSS